MRPGFADFQSFAQGFGFASREAIFEASVRDPLGRIPPGL